MFIVITLSREPQDLNARQLQVQNSHKMQRDAREIEASLSLSTPKGKTC